MSSAKKSYFKIQSDNFDPKKEIPIKMEVTITLGNQIQSLEEELTKNIPEEEINNENSSDSLFIKFKSNQKVSDELQAYIEENLGMYELIEDGLEKILVFELKINDIDNESIKETYKAYFSENVEEFYCDFVFEKN